MDFKYTLSRFDTRAPKRDCNSFEWDLFSDQDITIEANTPTIIQVGFQLQYVPEGWVAILKKKDNQPSRKIYGSVVDREYRDAITITMECSTRTYIKRGEHIAQMVFIKLYETGYCIRCNHS